MPSSLFISYAHRDMDPTHWLEKLKTYLAPVRRRGSVDVWDDKKIQTGGKWRSQIEEALRSAHAAVLLVGPGFLESEFINDVELPTLLSSANKIGLQIFPLVTGYCGYTRSSLGDYQSFNDPEKPLESLVLHEQNKMLNAFSIAIDDALRHPSALLTPTVAATTVDLEACITLIMRSRSNTYKAFQAQARRRDDLVTAITTRLHIKNDLQYEKFFFKFYAEMTNAERFEFDQIRALTTGPLYTGNRAILETIGRCPVLLDEFPILVDVQQHLVFWLNKYEKVFTVHPEMCLLYTGVEDGVPFPPGVDEILERWTVKRKSLQPQKNG